MERLLLIQLDDLFPCSLSINFFTVQYKVWRVLQPRGKFDGLLSCINANHFVTLEELSEREARTTQSSLTIVLANWTPRWPKAPRPGVIEAMSAGVVRPDNEEVLTHKPDRLVWRMSNRSLYSQKDGLTPPAFRPCFSATLMLLYIVAPAHMRGAACSKVMLSGIAAA